MTFKFHRFMQMTTLLALLICLAIGGINNSSAEAITCSWTAAGGTDWGTPTSWSCGHMPTSTDTVLIRTEDYSTDEYPRVNCQTTGVDANNFTIEAAAKIEFFGAQPCVLYANNLNNSGTMLLSFPSLDYGLGIQSPFNNDGKVDIQKGYLTMMKGGTHTGEFIGANGTLLSIGHNAWVGQTFTFSLGSKIQVPHVYFPGGDNANHNIIVINGEFIPNFDMPPSSSMNISNYSEVTLATDSVLEPQEVSIAGHLSLGPLSPDGYRFQSVTLWGNSLSSDEDIEILNKFIWRGGKLSGSGTFTISAATSEFKIQNGVHTLDGMSLINHAQAQWSAGNITLENGAKITNNELFKATGTTTMSGTGTEAFINNGVLNKDTASTTTTLNIPAENNGEILINAGNLVFGQGITNGTDTTVTLGNGNLNPGTTYTLNTGDSLVGSGYLQSNLVNGGMVSPGSSPGVINISGNYTQQESGLLNLELGGTSPGTGYDQLAITGSATLGGTLNVTLIDGFTPAKGDSFTLLAYGSQTGSFGTVNLPALGPDLRWKVDVQDTSFRLVVEGIVGTIGGTITYEGKLPLEKIVVNAFVDTHDSPVAEASIVAVGDNYVTYLIEDLPVNTYYVSAFIDKAEDGGPPLPDEPMGWYDNDGDGTPDAIQVQGDDSISDINITLEDPFHNVFLPLILR